jgi:hypothetical protein
MLKRKVRLGLRLNKSSFTLKELPRFLLIKDLIKSL